MPLLVLFTVEGSNYNPNKRHLAFAEFPLVARVVLDVHLAWSWLKERVTVVPAQHLLASFVYLFLYLFSKFN